MLLKAKLSLGLGLLFVLIFGLAGFCSYYVQRLGQESDNILKDNYKSIVYSRNMISALEDMRTSVSSMVFNRTDGAVMFDYYSHLFESGKSQFETNLKAENGNITEVQEKEYVEKLNHDYQLYLAVSAQVGKGESGIPAYFGGFLPACETLRQSINAITDINMQAVVRKSQLAKHDAGRFIASMAAVGSFCVLLALGYFWYFPFYVSNSISYLATRTRELVNAVGIPFDPRTNDEAYVILQAIGLLENKLGVRREDGAP
ncbi:MAG TPA: hypothetical protein VMU02_03505 [bacterium]|nr:hypothetical protein [bacterium]